jgi:hypothetical protein
MSCSSSALATVTEYLAAALPSLQAVYLFGSQASTALQYQVVSAGQRLW